MSNEDKFYGALKRISAYMPASKLRAKSEKLYGLDGEEAIEMAYENVIEEAKRALRGYRKSKPTKDQL